VCVLQMRGRGEQKKGLGFRVLGFAKKHVQTDKKREIFCAQREKKRYP